MARALIIMLCQSTLPQHDHYHVLQERTMSINKQWNYEY